jgi:hypothetical protein
MDLDNVKCEVCGAGVARHRCDFCGRHVCRQCSPDPQEPCRGCFELDDEVEATAGPDRPKENPPAGAHAKSVCVDLDGVLARYDRWRGIEHIGAPLPGAADFTRRLKDLGVKVVIFTTRVNPAPETSGHTEPVGMLSRRVQEWLDKNGFTYDEIYIGTGKPVACA